MLAISPSFRLERDEVHVWIAPLDGAGARRDALEAVLSPDEAARAARFRFEEDRRRFVAARGTLRSILGRYLGCAAAEVRFEYGPFGKPLLAAPGEPQPLHFNLSHAGELALLAVARGRRVGIDVEQIRPLRDLEALVERFFAAYERATIGALAPELRQEAFFTCWTRKEAYIKARGEGLTFPLHAFDVTILPSDPAGLRSVSGDAAEASRWSLREIRPRTGYVAALAVEGQDWHLICSEWPG